MGREPATPSMLEIDLESRELHAVRRSRSTPACRSLTGLTHLAYASCLWP